MMYPQHYGAQLMHSPAATGTMPPLFSSTPRTRLGSAAATPTPTPSSSTGISLLTPIRAVKRSLSDDSSDDDMDSSNKSLQLADSNMDGGCHLMSRKKRRGLIEKRRRDRINNSLHELKRLVPAAFEKQGSAKLEKAEILQMTVDHLRMLHSKGFDAFSFDPQKFATDYHLIGFRECATEVARYLAVHEGIDFQDPLRLRLMGHLHSYSSQREISLKSCTGWNPNLFTTPMYSSSSVTPSTAASASTSAINPNQSASSTSASTSISSSSHSSSNVCESMQSHNSGNNNTSGSSGSSLHNHSYSASYANYAPLDSSMMNAGASGSSASSTSSMAPCNASNLQAPSAAKSPSAFSVGYAAASTHPPSTSTSYTYPYTASSYFAPSAGYMPPMMPTGNNLVTNPNVSQSSVKHYRPWGTELAY